MKQEFRVERDSNLFRREFLTLVSIDIAITQHAFVISGYVLTALLFGYLGGVVYGDTMSFLLSWVTIGKNNESELFSLFMGAFGTIGIALVVSVIVTTYDALMKDFPQSSEDIESYIDTNLVAETKDLSFDFESLDEERKANFVKMMASDKIRQTINSGYLGNPTLTKVWFSLRNRDRVIPQEITDIFPFAIRME